MPIVKKLVESWHPAERPNLQVGETIYISDPRQLLKNGVCVLVDEVTGEELSQTEQIDCPVCAKAFTDLKEFQEHLSTHTSKTSSTSTGAAEVKVYSCKHCSQPFDQPLKLAVHVRKEHGSS